MRRMQWLAAVVLAGLATPAWAGTFEFFTSNSPVQNQVITQPSTNVATGVPIAQPMTLSRPKVFRLDSYIPTFRGFSNTRTIGQSQFPTAAQMPGPDYLKAFKYGRGVPIVP